MTSLRACPRPWLIGVLHLPALPGAPGASVPIEDASRHAVEDALILQDLGFTALMVENFHDVPFPAGDAAPETIASMAVVPRAVRDSVDMPVGVQVVGTFLDDHTTIDLGRHLMEVNGGFQAPII